METNQIIVKMVFDRWYSLIERCDEIFKSLSDERLEQEIATSKNRGIYILGHLIAVHDDMMPILNFGEKLFPELKEIFIKSPDKTVKEIPSTAELRTMWSKQNEVMTKLFKSLKAEEWFKKHNSVSDEDFIKEPHRNKLNIIVTRVSHLAYHNGQLVLM
ncbi:hypothetical protein [Aurantibacillus circumpalustris]|uniref:hypothetical protein n=1 Tax=Aurantibacillus circumpalustris TaxID=3036359 RepID=UPI00295BF3D8|nr:hypothetical protein [Aurantibacillus circumpalustris]